MSNETFVGRPNPMLWRGEEVASGVFVGNVDDGLRVLDMPQGVRAYRPALEHAGELGVAGREMFDRVVRAMCDARADAPAERLSLAVLPPQDKQILDQLWGEGEVGVAAEGERRFRARESVFQGLWRVFALDAIGQISSEWLEAGAIPGFVPRFIDAAARTDIEVDGTRGATLMNALPVLNEIRARARAWESGVANHVINFTLLPLTPEDTRFIVDQLGECGLRFVSEGYGSCRVIATALKHVWSVQYFNSTGKVILDTIEIGDVPVAVRAAHEDFVDSAERLREIRGAYIA
jgi:hydrogenase-1 operon protein HyaF